jgi:PAS domain S-box-containing protein
MLKSLHGAASFSESCGTDSGAVLAPQEGSNMLRDYEEVADFVEHGTVPMHCVGPDGRILWANQAELELLGYSREEYLGRHIAEFHVDQPVIEDILARLKAKQTLRSQEARLRCKNGAIKHVQIDSSVYWKNEQFVHTRCFTKDVTHEKNSQEQALRNYRQLQQIYQLTDSANRAETLEEIYAAALEAILVSIGTDRASILLLESDGVMRFKAWRGLSENYRQAVEGHSPWPRDAPDPRPVLVEDVQECPLEPCLRQTVMAEGIGALAFIPLVSNQQLLGKFMLYYGHPHQFTPQEILLAENIGRQVSFAIDRKKKEEALLLYRHIFIKSNDGIGILGPDARYLEQNQAHQQLLGFSHEELAGQTPALHMGEENFQNLAGELRRNGSVRQEIVSRRKDGAQVSIDLSAFSVLDAKGEVLCFVGLKRDITSRKQTEQALKEATEKLSRYAQDLERRVAERTAQLEETVRSLESFSYSIAHDLRAPLRAMKGFTSALLEDYSSELDPIGQDYARRIAEGAGRMDSLIQDLLSYGRLSQVELSFTWVSVRDQIGLILQNYSEEIASWNASVQVKEGLPQLWANPTVFEQVLTNLFSNALKFRPQGRTPEIRIWGEERDGKGRVYIKDNGIGIEPAHQERIFQVFERLHGAETYPGTGIGLAIVRKGIERMGGKVGLESHPGKGSCFWIELPAQRQH